MTLAVCGTLNTHTQSKDSFTTADLVMGWLLVDESVRIIPEFRILIMPGKVGLSWTQNGKINL